VRHQGSKTFWRLASKWWRGRCKSASVWFLTRPTEIFLVLVFVKGWVDPRSIVLREGLGYFNLRESNQQISGLLHNAATHYATACSNLFRSLLFYLLIMSSILSNCFLFWHQLFYIQGKIFQNLISFIFFLYVSIQFRDPYICMANVFTAYPPCLKIFLHVAYFLWKVCELGKPYWS
jgi:hypothetical protein